MVLFNYSTKELTAKIVYYGPGLCGKTTNLQFIHGNLPDNVKGKMLSLATKTDRTLFFDFLPIDLGDIRGMKTRVQLYTVPGQVFYNETRKLVLKGADGIVFVADSQEAMLAANLEAFRNLEENLKGHGLRLADMPHVIQFNKRDLPKLASLEELNATLNKYNAPFYESVATTGIGVQDTLKAIVKLVLLYLTKKYDPKADRTAAAAAPVTGRPAPAPRPVPTPRVAPSAGSIPLSADPHPALSPPPAPPARPATRAIPVAHAETQASAMEPEPLLTAIPLSDYRQTPAAATGQGSSRTAPPPPPNFSRRDAVADEGFDLGLEDAQPIGDLESSPVEPVAAAHEPHSPEEEEDPVAASGDAIDLGEVDFSDPRRDSHEPSFEVDRGFDPEFDHVPPTAPEPARFAPDAAQGGVATMPAVTTEVLLTDLADAGSLFSDPDLDIARLRPGAAKEIVVPVEMGSAGMLQRYKLTVRLSLELID